MTNCLVVEPSREESDKDFAYSITTRVPECFGSTPRCYRLEQTYSVGPLALNTEVVLRTSSSLKNNRTLYTDDNGYQMMERRFRKFVNNTLARVSPDQTIFKSLNMWNHLYLADIVAELLPHGASRLH